MADRVLYEFETTRVISNGKSPENGDDIIVQQKDGDAWRDLTSYNSLSDDYAFTNARDSAKRRDRDNKNAAADNARATGDGK